MKLGKSKVEKLFDHVSQKLHSSQNNGPVEPEKAQPEKKEEIIVNKMAICPYCFKEFNLDRVLFRAAEESLQMSETGEGVLQLEKTLDTKFVRHWDEDRGWGIDTNELREFPWGYGEVPEGYAGEGTLLSTAKVNCILSPDMIVDFGKTNGIPTSAIDKNGIETDRRICPKCHCLLPAGYGTRRTVFIAVVGIKNAGKTVFLSQFFKEAGNLLQNAGLQIGNSPSMEMFAQAKRIAPGERLPVGTPKEKSPPPVFATLNAFHIGENVDCVFFDIAGENCDEASDFADRGKNVAVADAIIMLLAPEQLPGVVKVKNRESEEDVATVLSAMAGGTLQGDGRELNAKSKVKLAVTVSMSDLFPNVQFETGRKVRKDSILLKNIDYNKNSRGFMCDEAETIEWEIRELIGEQLPGMVSLNYEHAKYFAISSLGCSPSFQIDSQGKKWGFAPKQCNPIRLEEPVLWILSELGIVKKSTKPKWTYHGEIQD